MLDAGPRQPRVRGAATVVAARAGGLVLGVLADAVLGDPRRGHPVAAFGSAAAAAEDLWWADSRRRGGLHVAACVLPLAVAGGLAERSVRGRPVAHAALVALVTWAVVGSRSLAREAGAVGTHLEAGRLDDARYRLRSLCGRDPADLPAHEVARAAVESVAENTSDAVVGPLVWGILGGVPGLLAHRAVNTLDAMVGHRSPRYERFGWAAARLDDALNLLPARLAAAAVALCAPVVSGTPGEALCTWRRDGRHHPSPNAGPVEASAAGALGVRLGGPSTYQGRVEVRGVLGSGRVADAGDVRRAVRLSRAAVGLLTTGVAAVGVLAAARHRGRP